MSITTQIFISCDLPVSPRSSQFELRPRLPSATTWQGTGGSPSSTDLGMDTLVRALNGHELLSCSGSAYTGLGASPSTNRRSREWRTGERRAPFAFLVLRDRNSSSCGKKCCPWHTLIIGHGGGYLRPTSRAHPQPVTPATYFVAYIRIQMGSHFVQGRRRGVQRAATATASSESALGAGTTDAKFCQF